MSNSRFGFVAVLPWWLLLILSPFIALFFAIWLMILLLYGFCRVLVFVVELAVEQVHDAIERTNEQRRRDREDI